MRCWTGGFLCLLGGVFGVFMAPSADGQERPSLRVLSGGYPRAFFFRSSEGWAANERITYERWEDCFSRLMGIEGKVLEEEVPGRSLRNIDFFTRFKREHPEQLVLLHYNGNARDPRFQIDDFFAGHWLYYNGATILGDVPEEEGETEIAVDNPALLKLNVGRYRNCHEDVALCLLDAEGKPDWHRSEQVQLVAVDPSRKTIRVRRGCFGTRPRAFPAGRAYAAAHMTEGPWGQRSHLLWYYNHSTRCPRDRRGRTCADVHCRELADRFLPGGELAAFDGLEFDVLHHTASRRSAGRAADCDADGKPDGGVFDGVDTYGVGVIEFCRDLRAKLGPDRIIQADGANRHNQRAFRILNGIESEGWPHLSDWEIRDWSGGLNRHFYWQHNAHPPAFSYVNHKFTAAGAGPGERVRPEVPFAVHRLVLAAAVLTDSAVCYSFVPDAEAGELIGVWDELRKGTENQLGWLGRPKGPAIRLAEKQPDIVAVSLRETKPHLAERDGYCASLLRRLTGEGVEFAPDGGQVKVTAADPAAGELRFRLSEVPCNGPDLCVFVTARGTPRHGYPAEAARLMTVGVVSPDRRDSSRPVPLMSWLGDRDFRSGFYFHDVAADTVDLECMIEGSEPVWISSVRAFAHPDAIYREFEHGLVLANPSPRPYAFDLERLLPGRKFRRLRGSSKQDPQANDGSPVAGKLTLGPREGLFLVAF